LPVRYWWVVVTYVLTQLSVLLFAPLLASLFQISPIQASIYGYIIGFILGLIVTLLILRPDMRMGSSTRAASVSESVIWAILGVFIAMAAQYAATLISLTLFDIEVGSENTQMLTNMSRSIPLFMIIPAIIGPILEELVFRKVLFGTFYKKMNFFFAALLSSLIFGLMHGEIQLMLTYTAMGFVFSFLYVKTKRIMVPIITHAGMNTLVLVLQLILVNNLEEFRGQMQAAGAIFLGM